jgi:predicted nuclease of restriction endonuclease-like (RecB) superfamily
VNKKIIKKDDQGLNVQEYAGFLEHIKIDILQTQLRAASSISKELIMLYWRIGKNLSEKIEAEGWGTKVVKTLADDLSKNFPGIAGFSLRNLQYMQKFAKTYGDSNCAAAAAQLPWAHNLVLMDKLDNINQIVWYAQQAIASGWSRSMLITWIESDLYHRKGKAVHNFKKTLPETYSDLAEQTLKDPYNFDFLMLDKDAREKELEDGLVAYVEQFLLELGEGFAFLGRQYHLVIGAKDVYLDMLFYHLELRCFVVVELKAKEFDARDIGQVNMYLSAVDDLVRRPGDNPTIGLLLCKSKENVMVEYALRDVNKPIGVANYKTLLADLLPEELKGKLPTIQQFEEEFAKYDLLVKKAKTKAQAVEKIKTQVNKNKKA